MRWTRPQDDNEDDNDETPEIFEDGDELAHFIADDLWPNALKYFSAYLAPLSCVCVELLTISQPRRRNKMP